VTISKKTLLPILFLVIGVSIFILLKMTRAEQPPAEIRERVWRVNVEEARPASLSPMLTLYGRIETPSLLKAAAPAEAIVEQVLVKEGEVVNRGQLLVRLDQRDFTPRLDQARAEVRQLEAEIASERQRNRTDRESLQQEKEILRLVQASVARAESLQKKSLGSDSALDEARQNASRQALVVISREYSIRDHEARLQQLEARLLQARARLTEIELELERSILTAPFDGIIARVMVATGDRVRKADVMLEMYDPQSLEIRARIPAPHRDELQAAVSRQQPLVGRTRIGDAEIVLSLSRLSGEADPRGIDGLFQVERGLRWLRLGEMLQFHLQRPPKEQAFSLPYQALHGGNRIYLLEDGRMRGIEVDALGSLIDAEGIERLVVASAEIASGAKVVTTHLPNAVTGLRAEVVE
jgi:multidrug efflux pump subunit AcrA (membrane-fusion protein)